MEITHYLEPVEATWDLVPGISHNESLGSLVSFFKGDKNWFRKISPQIVIFGVPEDRNGIDNRGCAQSPDAIRKLLYGLRGFGPDLVIGDAGNVRGQGINDRYQALKEVAEWFIGQGSVVVVLGGTQDLTYPLFNALSSINKHINVVVGDAMIDLDVSNNDFSSRAWLNRIIGSEETCLNDLTIFGVQNYLVSSAQESLIHEKHFDIIRLGEVRGTGIIKTEVPLRDSHLVSVDMRMVIGQHQFNEKVCSPHGIEPFEACQLSRYSGLSDQLKIFGLFEVIGDDKLGVINISLASQMIWHFIDGFINRFEDFPIRSLDEYKFYVVHLEEFGEGLKFYQNPINGRWWMEVPSETGTVVVACEYEDYSKALHKELPEKWWRFFLKCRGGSMEANN